MVKTKGRKILGRLGVQGVLQVPLLLALFSIVMGGFGIWGYLRRWRFLMETQLRLDQCVGTTAQEFRDSVNSLMTSNQEVLALRAAIMAAQMRPELIPPLKLALEVVVGHQEWVRLKWKFKCGEWLVKKGCGKRRDWAMPLPNLDFNRGPADQIGQQMLKWAGKDPPDFHLQVMNFPRYSSARIEGGCFEATKTCKKWVAVWSAPRRNRTSFY